MFCLDVVGLEPIPKEIKGIVKFLVTASKVSMLLKNLVIALVLVLKTWG